MPYSTGFIDGLWNDIAINYTHVALMWAELGIKIVIPVKDLLCQQIHVVGIKA